MNSYLLCYFVSACAVIGLIIGVVIGDSFDSRSLAAACIFLVLGVVIQARTGKSADE